MIKLVLPPTRTPISLFLCPFHSCLGAVLSVEYGLKAYIPLRHKTIHVGSLHWLRPPMPQFRVGDTNMLVSKKAKICVTPNSKHKICITPNANPQRESVEYRLRWDLFLCWPCTFSFFGVDFICVGSRFSVEYVLYPTILYDAICEFCNLYSIHYIGGANV